MDAVEKLRKAAGIIEQYGATSGRFVRDDCFCALGALLAAEHGPENVSYDGIEGVLTGQSVWDMLDNDEAVIAVSEHVPDYTDAHEENLPSIKVFSWNDSMASRGRFGGTNDVDLAAELIAKFKQVADELEAENGSV